MTNTIFALRPLSTFVLSEPSERRELARQLIAAAEQHALEQRDIDFFLGNLELILSELLGALSQDDIKQTFSDLLQRPDDSVKLDGPAADTDTLDPAAFGFLGA